MDTLTRAELREAQGDHNLLDIALYLHGFYTGSLEASPQDIRRWAEIVEASLTMWEPPIKMSVEFDCAVKHVLEIALKEAKKELLNYKVGANEVPTNL